MIAGPRLLMKAIREWLKIFGLKAFEKGLGPGDGGTAKEPEAKAYESGRK